MPKQLKTSHVKQPISIPTDAGFDENCKMVVEEFVQAFGRIDILVNNACVWHALKHMKEGSSIINTASSHAYVGHCTLLGYSATRGAVVTFTRSLALSLADKGMRLNGIAPGPRCGVWTPLVASLTTREVVSFGADKPLGRAAQPYEIAPAFVFLTSNDASYITGQFIHPNGGLIMNA